MRAILFKNGVEIRRVNDYAKISPSMGVVDFSIKGQPNPDTFEWKLLVEGIRPAVSSIENLVRNEVDNDAVSTYPPLKKIDVEYTAVRKSDPEIEELIKEAEKNANEGLINEIDRLKIMVLYMAIVNRKVNGDPINAKMQAILDKVNDYAIKLWNNDSNLKAKLQQVINGEDPDINTNWE